MSFKFSKRSIERMKGIHPELRLVVMEAIYYSPIDFGIPGDGGVRTAERQNELYRKGVSKCDGYRNRSNHQVPEGEDYGHALDFYPYVNHKVSWDKTHLAMVASVILSIAKRLKDEGVISIELKWGGEFGSNDFNGWDYPHIEIK